MCYYLSQDWDLITHAYRRIGYRVSFLHLQIDFDHSGSIRLSALCRRGFHDVVFHFVIAGASHVLYLLPPLLLCVIH